MGIGDIVVGKHIGKMMSMLGGRLGAYRDGLAAGDLAPALVRNLYRGQAPAAEAVAHVASALTALRTDLEGVPLDRLTAGDLP
jgi:cytochrome b pre-mRNA-processing protein 3